MKCKTCEMLLKPLEDLVRLIDKGVTTEFMRDCEGRNPGNNYLGDARKAIKKAKEAK